MAVPLTLRTLAVVSKPNRSDREETLTESREEVPTGEFLLRLEFAGEKEAIRNRLMKTTGVGGLLWIKRKFEITVEMIPATGS